MKFTIAIPAYKGSFLNECIQSILNQTCEDFELIIVNDASPEDLDEIVNMFSDPRIKYFKNKVNNGAEHVVDNWNICFSYARGDYFVLMGDDDLMEPNYLMEFSFVIKKNPELDVFHCRSYIIDEKSEKVGLTPSWPEYESVFENIYHRMKFGRIQFISDFVYKMKSLKDNKGFFKLPLAWGSDDISSFIAMKNNGIVHINKPIFCYRSSSITITRSGNFLTKLDAIEQYEKWLRQFLLSSNPMDFVDVLLKKNIMTFLPTFYKKKKINIISRTFDGKWVTMLFFWIRNSKKYHLNNKEVGYAFIEFIKGKYRKN